MISGRSLLALCAVLAVLAVALCDKDDDDFEEFKAKHRKHYKDPAEHEMRKALHKKTKSIVDKHNEEYAQGKHTYWQRVPEHADWTPEEKRARQPKKQNARVHLRSTKRSAVTAPTTYKDWTTTGIVPPVRDQGGCGSCWAFSSADTVAYYYAAANAMKAPLEFSTQQLVDCAMGYPGTATNGCNGGNAVNVYDYVQGAGSINQDYSYPYVSGTTDTWTGKCSPNASAGVSVWTNKTVTALGVAGANNETAMAAYLASKGPGVISIFAACDAFMNYGGGLLSNVCGSCTINGVAATCEGTDHDVMIVAYLMNSTTGVPYYRVKNSWNTNWGQAGYFELKFGDNELNLADSGIQYPVGIGKSATAATPLPFAEYCVAPTSETVGGSCLTGCNSEGACCTSSSQCYQGVCDPNAKICMPSCTAATGCNGGANATQGEYGGASLDCVFYGGSGQASHWGATCTNGYCVCPKN